MIRRAVVCSLVFSAMGLWAQQPQTQVFRARTGAIAGVPPAGIGGGDFTYNFVSAGGSFDGEVVKGAPYSADAVTEMVQSLADGNRIRNSNESKIFRDSEGRTRREQTLGFIGPWASADEPARMIFVHDPVANANYVLDPQRKTARKSGAMKLPPPPMAAGGGGVATFERRIEVNEMRFEQRSAGSGPVRAAAPPPPPMDHTVMFFGAEAGPMGGDVAKESLGSRMIEGVEAEGTRTTQTIAAGAIGNEQPIKIVSERWYSPELKTLVMSKSSDPRHGESVYRLTNIQRVEPLPAMFEIPPDYEIDEAKNVMINRVGGEEIEIIQEGGKEGKRILHRQIVKEPGQ